MVYCKYLKTHEETKTIAEVLATFPYPLTKENNLSNTPLRFTKRGKRVRAIIILCLLSSVYAGLNNESDAVVVQAKPDIYTQQTVQNKLAVMEGLTVETEHFLTEDGLVQVLRQAGFEGSSLKMAWAIAMRESTGKANALNDNPKTGDLSYGLFQINMIGKMGQQRLEQYGLNSYEDLYNPLTNARVAFQMSNSGTNWGPWNIGASAYDRTGKSADRSSVRKWLAQFPG